MLKNWKLQIAAIVTLLTIGTPFQGQCADTGAKSSSLSRTADDAVRAVIMNLETAISAKNPDNAAALFSPDVHFVDEAGNEVNGRQSMRDRFDQFFKADVPRVLGIHPQNITFLADSVAVVVGEVSRQSNQSDLPVSKFTMVMVRKDNTWLINDLTETLMTASQTENHLQELGWLVGDWSAEKTDASASLHIEWAPGKKFILSKYTIKRNGSDPQVDSQVIGWDPQHNDIISWHFDSNGGFGSGKWTRNEKKWVVEVVGVGADGSNSVANNVFTEKSADEFSWQSINRTLDGGPVPDTPQVILHRAKR